MLGRTREPVGGFLAYYSIEGGQRKMRKGTVIFGFLALLAAGQDATAQTDADARGAVLQGANLGDRLTVTLRDGARMHGRLIDTRDGLVLRHRDDQRTFSFGDLETVTRRKNGLILGPIIGTAAGLAIGLPVRTRLNNEGENGDKALTVLVVSGVAIGTLLDALMGSERTVYRRPRTGTVFSIAPARGGVTARWQRAW